MMTTYGNYMKDGKSDSNYSIVALRSQNQGHDWHWLGTVAHGSPAPCHEPCENDCVRRADGSLYCVWRSGGSGMPLCTSTSRDEGRTWSPGVPIGGWTPPPPPPPQISAQCQAKLDQWCNDRGQDSCINSTLGTYPDAMPFFALDDASCCDLQCPGKRRLNWNCTCSCASSSRSWRCFSHLAVTKRDGRRQWSPQSPHPNAEVRHYPPMSTRRSIHCCV